jgi:hypothetical protein
MSAAKQSQIMSFFRNQNKNINDSFNENSSSADISNETQDETELNEVDISSLEPSKSNVNLFVCKV